MTHLRLVHSQPADAAPSVKGWASNFHIVDKLWRELFKQMLSSFALQTRPCTRFLPPSLWPSADRLHHRTVES